MRSLIEGRPNYARIAIQPWYGYSCRLPAEDWTMAIDVDGSERALDNEAKLPRKTWVKPEILLTTLAEDTAGSHLLPGDGLSNLS
jgi:hypothetical protein